jgi:uncharacterized protein YegL
MAGPIADVALIDNSDERVPLVLVLDCSGSMEGDRIRLLNAGLQALEEDLKSDPITVKRGRVLVVTYGGDNQVEIAPWQDAMDFSAPTLTASGLTPMAAAVVTALDAIETQKAEMRSAGVSYKRPIMMLMSDGNPTDEWESVAERCRAAEQAKKVNVMAIAVGDDADKGVLDQFSTKQALRLDGLKFKELFIWLSQSVRAVSRAAKGEVAQLPAASGWMQMGTDSEVSGLIQ